MSLQSRHTKLQAASVSRRSNGTDGLQVSVMVQQLTLILFIHLLLSGCGPTRPQIEPPADPSVAQSSEVRSWVLKAHWAEQHGEIEEALRCWKWVLRLDGNNPYAVESAQAFAQRNGIVL